MNFKDEMKQKVAQIEIILDEYLPAQEGLQKTVLTAMNTTVKAGGKRLRPMLINETYQMFGGKGDIVKPFMAAIEMIHTYSLIHDDLPALDNDDYRRGRLTTHMEKIWRSLQEMHFLIMRMKLQRKHLILRRKTRS